MKKSLNFIITLLFLSLCLSVNSQTNKAIVVKKYISIKEFGFDNYKNNNIVNQKNKGALNLNNNKFAKQYKTKILELYKNSKINFAGKYTIIIWDGGMGSTFGTLIDCNSGKVYDVPINDETASISCFDKNKLNIFKNNFGENKVFFKKDSNLLVLRSCDEYSENGILFRFYLWNENLKKFTLIKIEKNQF